MNRLTARLGLALIGALWGAAAGAAGWNPQAPQGATAQLEAAQETIAKFKATDPGLDVFFEKAYGYAVFPTIGSGGYWFSGAYGTGLVYEGNTPIGRASLTQVSFGFTFGAQAYSEILFFRDKSALDKFKAGTAQLSAQASAVIATNGAAAKTSYDSNGVGVFVHVKGGAMLDASVGGQNFKYQSGLGD